MSSETDILDRLREAHSTGGTPSIDLAALLERGHRTRRRRTVTRWTGGVGVAVLAAGMVVAGQTWDASLTPAGPSGPPSDGTVTHPETAAPTAASTSQFVPAMVLGQHPDWPDGMSQQEPGSAFVNPDGTVTVWTSTSCRSLPTQIRQNASTIDVVVAPTSTACTFDAAVSPWVVALPEDSTADEDTHIRVIEDPDPESPAFLAVEIQESHRGWPPGIVARWRNGSLEVDLEARTVTVWTVGSSTCPGEPQAIRADGDLIEIIVGMPAGAQVCTADLGPTTYVLGLPPGYAPEGEPRLEWLQVVEHLND